MSSPEEAMELLDNAINAYKNSPEQTGAEKNKRERYHVKRNRHSVDKEYIVIDYLEKARAEKGSTEDAFSVLYYHYKDILDS